MSRIMKNLSVLVLLGVACGVSVAAVDQPPKAENERLATVHQLMEGLVHPSYLALEEAVKKGRLDGRTAASLTTKSALLNEAGFMLVDNKRSRGETWDDAVKQLRRESAAMTSKIKARDKEGALASLEALTNACVNCHAAYR